MGNVPTRRLISEGGGLEDPHQLEKETTLGPIGRWIVRSHIDFVGEKNESFFVMG